MSAFISYGSQCVEEDDIEFVAQALRGDMLTGGPFVTQFETALTTQTGAPHAVACSNGTAALHLVMLGLDIGPGDVVIVPGISFVATANCARFVGADVVFADVDPQTGLMTPETLAAAIKASRTIFPNGHLRAAIAVHLCGQTEDMARMAEVCESAGIALLADACHALGTTYGTNGDQVGSAKHALCETFSFHPVKAIATGEGGAVTCRDAALAERIALMRSHGITRDKSAFTHATSQEPQPWYYEMQMLGFNYRLNDIQAALGLSQLNKLERFRTHRAALTAQYRRVLAPLPPDIRPVPALEHSDPNWHLMSVLIDFDALGTSRGAVMGQLAKAGFGTQVHYIPIFQQPYFIAYLDEVGQDAENNCPGAVSYYDKQLSFPLHMDVTPEHVSRIAELLGDITAAKGS